MENRDTLALLLKLKRRYGDLNTALVAVALEVHPDMSRSLSALARYVRLNRSAVRRALGVVSDSDR